MCSSVQHESFFVSWSVVHGSVFRLSHLRLSVLLSMVYGKPLLIYVPPQFRHFDELVFIAVFECFQLLVFVRGCIRVCFEEDPLERIPEGSSFDPQQDLTCREGLCCIDTERAAITIGKDI